jgi:hypothetical protein
MTGENIEQESLDAMKNMIENEKDGVVIDLLPRNCDETVAIGLSVAVDAIRDGNEDVAKASLETVVDRLEEKSENK